MVYMVAPAVCGSPCWKPNTAFEALLSLRVRSYTDAYQIHVIL